MYIIHANGELKKILTIKYVPMIALVKYVPLIGYQAHLPASNK